MISVNKLARWISAEAKNHTGMWVVLRGAIRGELRELICVASHSDPRVANSYANQHDALLFVPAVLDTSDSDQGIDEAPAGGSIPPPAHHPTPRADHAKDGAVDDEINEHLERAVGVLAEASAQPVKGKKK